MFRSLIISVLVAFAAPAALANQEAENVIETAAERLSVGEFDSEALTETLDAAGIARFTLGRFARRLEVEEVDRFSQAFEQYLIENFEAESYRFEGADIEVEGSLSRSARDSIVLTRVSAPGLDTQRVRWRVIERKGQWRVVDVEIAGLWLAVEQRAQISAILGRSGATVNDAIDALGVEG